MKGFTPAKWALAGFALAAACAAPAANAEMVGRYHVCGKLNAAPFKAQLSSQGMGCSRARPLLRAWLGRSTSLSGEGMPRSTRAHHWQCRRVIAWACTVNGHKVRIVFDLDLRRHGDLAASMKAAFATGPAGQAYVDYGVTVRNLGSDVVSGRLVETLPANAGFVGAVSAQGSCGTPDAGGRLRCSLGGVPTGFDNGVRVTIRVAYDCASFDPVGPSAIAVASPAGDIDPSNNLASVDELDPDCPDPEFDFPPDPPDPPIDEPDPDPPPVDPAPPPEDPAPPPEDPAPPTG